MKASYLSAIGSCRPRNYLPEFQTCPAKDYRTMPRLTGSATYRQICRIEEDHGELADVTARGDDDRFSEVVRRRNSDRAGREKRLRHCHASRSDRRRNTR